MNKLVVVLAASLMLGLSACSSSAPVAHPSPKPKPTQAVATENQVASVLAEYASDWQDVISTDARCRLDYTIGGDAADMYVCVTREKTMGITADLVTKKWATLKIPESMAPLVSETSETLTAITEADFEGNCAPSGDYVDSKACDSTLGTLYGLDVQLKQNLDAWSPYL